MLTFCTFAAPLIKILPSLKGWVGAAVPSVQSDVVLFSANVEDEASLGLVLFIVVHQTLALRALGVLIGQVTTALMHVGPLFLTCTFLCAAAWLRR